MSYHLRYPVSQKSSYASGDNVDLTLSYPMQSILGNSVRLSGLLNVFRTGTTHIALTDKIYYDPAVGINNFFNHLVVSSFSKGVLESQSDYPRWIKMKHSATRTASQLVSNSRYLTQLMCQDETTSTVLMTGQMPFSVDLDCCLNNVVDSAEIPYSKFGDITISFRIPQALESLYGPDMTNAVNFVMSNLACEYLTIPESKSPLPTTMRVNYSAKQIINSMNSSINIKLPAVVDRVSASFMKVAEELQLVNNNVELERPAGITKLYYTFNDSTNTFVSYPLESVEDMLEHYLDSFINDDVKNGATLRKVCNDELFGIGLNLESSISLAQTSFGLNILSAIQTVDPYYIYAYFKGILSF